MVPRIVFTVDDDDVSSAAFICVVILFVFHDDDDDDDDDDDCRLFVVVNVDARCNAIDFMKWARIEVKRSEASSRLLSD